MSAQTLNVIYDTNYVNIIPDGGFIDHNFVKKPWFFDLLFWPLSSKDQTQQVSNSSTPSKNTEWWDTNGWIAEITQNHEIAQTEISKRTNEVPQKKKKSWIDSMLDAVFWTDEWSKKNDNAEKTTDSKKLMLMKKKSLQNKKRKLMNYVNKLKKY